MAEASLLTGSIGMLPSASLGERAAPDEPIHGSAPDIAGQHVANPLGMILSAAMMLRISFGMQAERKRSEEAVRTVLKEGLRTRDFHQAGTVGRILPDCLDPECSSPAMLLFLIQPKHFSRMRCSFP